MALPERAERLKTIAVEMDQLVREIGPKWIRLAHLRAESRAIIEELQRDAGPGK
jgi:hypothetical protein